MAQIQGPAYTGQTSCDLANVKDVLVDLVPGALVGARVEQNGIAAVLVELAQVMPIHGEEAEVRVAIHDRVMAATIALEKLGTHEIVLEKMLEVVRETKGLLMNNREHDINVIASRAIETAHRQGKPQLMALFEKTITYRSQIAHKAAVTRKKNRSPKNEVEAPESTAHPV
jgi:hypothetical protein